MAPTTTTKKNSSPRERARRDPSPRERACRDPSPRERACRDPSPRERACRDPSHIEDPTPKEQLRKVVHPTKAKRASGRAKEAVDFAEAWLLERADVDAAAQMNAYMRADERGDVVLCVGVPKPIRKDLNRTLKKEFVPTSPEEFEAIVRALFRSTIREAAMSGAEMCRFWPRAFFGSQHLPLYAELIREGGWWDLVDIVAAGVVPRALKKERAVMTPVVDGWIDNPNVWMRRASILSQLFSEEDADLDLLFAHCRRRMHEKEFFIRKAIGWALREASKRFPDPVEEFLLENKSALSGLSFREGAKVLRRDGRLASTF